MQGGCRELMTHCGRDSPTVMLMELLGGELSSSEGNPPLIL